MEDNTKDHWLSGVNAAVQTGPCAAAVGLSNGLAYRAFSDVETSTMTTKGTRQFVPKVIIMRLTP